MSSKATKWEKELWSYLSDGDGTNCPPHSYCKIRRTRGPCPDDHKPLFKRLDSIKRSNPDNYFSIMANDTDFTNFVEHWIPGRIFQLVEKLAYKYLKKGGVSGPPVPTEIVSLADENNAIEVHLLPLKTRRGAIWRLNSKWVIQLNAQDSPAQRRFTLFHEAFHILAHCQATPVFNGPGKEGSYFNELLADYFASCILLPRIWVTEKWAEINNMSRMAEVFGVLEPHIWMRLKQLHLTR